MTWADELRADCASCVGLCCVAPGFARSADFAIDKPPGTPCPNLLADFRCGIHSQLAERGFPGCTAFDCLGAGQRVTRAFAGRDWRDDADTAGAMFTAFRVTRELHELLWYLADARSRTPTQQLYADLRTAYDETERLAVLPPEDLRTLDVAAHHQRVDALLRRTSELIRKDTPARMLTRDSIGARLAKADLRGSDLRGVMLIGADLQDADLRKADLIGSDLRAADLRGADLREALFVTPMQLAAARTDTSTRLPQWVTERVER